MTTVLHALQGAESLLLTLARLWAAAGELLTAGALLLALDRLAAAIRTTYQAGALMGRLLWPAIYWIAAVCKLIDWRFVALVVIDCLKVLIAFSVTLTRMALPALIKGSAAMGRAYAAMVVAKPAPSTPAINPLAAMAEELEALTCKQLQALIGTKRKCRKSELVAMALAY